MRKIIMHVDINQFFAAATRLLDPSLSGKPLVIGVDDRRGIVSTASYEARAYGIHSAQPIYQAKKLCKNLIIREPDFAFYTKKSHEFIEFIKANYTQEVEQASIDECYCDMTEAMKDVKDPYAYLKKLQKEIYDNTRLDVSIGLAPTKFLAKMGSDYKKPKGITIIRKRDIPTILYPLKIEDFYGIGKKTYPLLKEIGINTIGDLANSNDYRLKKILGKFYNVAKEWLNGNGDDHVSTLPFDPKSISSVSTFPYDTNDYEEIISLLKERTNDVVRDLKRENKLTKTITLVIKTSDFKTKTKALSIDEYTDDIAIVYQTLLKIFDVYFKDQLIRLAGIQLSNLIVKENYYVQISLFDQNRHQKDCKTKLLINELNLKANKKLFIEASELKDK